MSSNKCSIKACIYLQEGQGVCPYHAHFFDYSVLDNRIARYELYKRDKDDLRWHPLFSVQPAREVFWKPRLFYVLNGSIQRPSDPFLDPKWGVLEMERQIRRAEEMAGTRMPKANRLTTAEVIKPDGTIEPTTTKQTKTSAAWKGYMGKELRWKDVRKKARSY